MGSHAFLSVRHFVSRYFICSTFCLFYILSVPHFVCSTFCLFLILSVDILSVRHFVCSTLSVDILSVQHYICRPFVCRHLVCLHYVPQPRETAFNRLVPRFPKRCNQVQLLCMGCSGVCREGGERRERGDHARVAHMNLLRSGSYLLR